MSYVKIVKRHGTALNIHLHCALVLQYERPNLSTFIRPAFTNLFASAQIFVHMVIMWSTPKGSLYERKYDITLL